MLGITKTMKMDGQPKKFVRFRQGQELDSQGSMGSECEVPLRKSFSINSQSAVRRGWEKSSRGFFRLGQSLKFRNSARVFDEAVAKQENQKYLDPSSPSLHRWNTFFVASCLVAVFVDPLFFYLPVVDNSLNCIKISTKLKISVTVFRTTTDFLYLVHMFLQFRTAYIAPSSRVFGRGALETNLKKIAARYMRKDFWLDFVAVLPIPQFVIWVVIPSLPGPQAIHTKNALKFIVFVQYFPRLLRIFPLTSKMINTTGVLMETAWAGAAFNLLLYLLASHTLNILVRILQRNCRKRILMVGLSSAQNSSTLQRIQVVGACWYMLAFERQDTCWQNQCSTDPLCISKGFFDCESTDPNSILYNDRQTWFANTTIDGDCNVPTSNLLNYGIYTNAIANNITTSSILFKEKYLYCLWLGLLALSSLTQTLSVSTFAWEIIFDIIIIILGLLLFAFLIGNMQTYLQSLTLRLEEMRVKRRDTEQWMRHRSLPQDIVNRVRRYDQYKWVATRGVDEETLVQSLPSDLRRDIKRHLCFDLVRNVPFCDQMDESLLDAMCERLKPALCTEGTNILREGDPVNEMFFVIRGQLESVTTNGGRTGFLNFGVLGVGDFCGEELLTWALDPKPQNHLPISTHTVRAVKEVEAFSLSSEDLKFVASQFRRLHSKQLQHTFRYYSHHWRTWGACFIQAAWRRYQRRRLAELRRKEEDQHLQEAMQGSIQATDKISLGATILAGRFAKNAMRGVQRLRSMHAAELMRISNIPKPAEPDFSLE